MIAARFSTARKFILVLLITLMVVVTAPTVSAQLPLLTGGGGAATAETGKSTPWWDINKARRCGRLWCSDVYLRGSFFKTLTIGYSPKPEESPQAAAAAVEFRAQQVESIFNSVYFQLIQLDAKQLSNRSRSIKRDVNLLRSKALQPRKVLTPAEPIPDVIPNLDIPKTPSPQATASPRPQPTPRPADAIPRQQLADPLRKNLEIHPLTPTVAVGIQNDQMVVFIPPQTELGLAQQTIVTVNEADEIANGKPVETLAYEWRDHIRESFDSALWGHELDQQYPWIRYQLSALCLAVLAIPVAILAFIRSILNRRDRQLRQQLRLLTQSLTKETESEITDPDSVKNIPAADPPKNREENNNSPPQHTTPNPQTPPNKPTPPRPTEEQ